MNKLEGIESNHEEDIKWKITRVDYLLEGSVDSLERAKDEVITKLTELYPSTIDDWRNKSLAAVTFIASILATVIAFPANSFPWVEHYRFWFLLIILLDIIVGIVIFFVSIYTRHIVQRRIRKIEIAFLNKINHLNKIKEIHGNYTQEPKYSSPDQLRLIVNYISLVNLDSLKLYNQLDKVSQSKAFKLRRIKEGIDQMLVNYNSRVNKYNDELKETKKIEAETRASSERIIKEYNEWKKEYQGIPETQREDTPAKELNKLLDERKQTFEIANRYLETADELRAEISITDPDTGEKPKGPGGPKMTAVWLILLTIVACSSIPGLMIWLTTAPK
jgi:hypothetical protein